MYYYKFVKNILLAIMIPFLSLITAIVIIDPLQVFHKSWFSNHYYYANFKLSALGVIKYADFDSIIIGSCMLENTSAKQASQKLGGKFINISNDAVNYFERSIILRKLFQQKKNIRHVIFSLDPYFIFSREAFSGKILDDCAFLYYENCINQLRKISVYIVFPQVFKAWYNKSGFTDQLDTPRAGNWIAKPGFNNWISRSKENKDSFYHSLFSEIVRCYEKEPVRVALKEGPKNLAEEIIEESIVPLVEKNPQTVFHIVIPPYSKLHWKTDTCGRLSGFECAVKYIVKRLKENKNAYIYGFDNESFTSNIDNYLDFHHYWKNINVFILEAIYKKTHLLTEKNVNKHFEQLKQESYNYDLKPFYDQIKKLVP